MRSTIRLLSVFSLFLFMQLCFQNCSPTNFGSNEFSPAQSAIKSGNDVPPSQPPPADAPPSQPPPGEVGLCKLKCSDQFNDTEDDDDDDNQSQVGQNTDENESCGDLNEKDGGNGDEQHENECMIKSQCEAADQAIKIGQLKLTRKVGFKSISVKGVVFEADSLKCGEGESGDDDD